MAVGLYQFRQFQVPAGRGEMMYHVGLRRRQEVDVPERLELDLARLQRLSLRCHGDRALEAGGREAVDGRDEALDGTFVEIVQSVEEHDSLISLEPGPDGRGVRMEPLGCVIDEPRQQGVGAVVGGGVCKKWYGYRRVSPPRVDEPRRNLVELTRLPDATVAHQHHFPSCGTEQLDHIEFQGCTGKVRRLDVQLGQCPLDAEGSVDSEVGANGSASGFRLLSDHLVAQHVQYSGAAG
ncbi:hypothetical protein [Blastococcus brunescens]|uniref:Uncharacterized protein n=1 Tax=Blastococcus brunescens TaxID=1564165 RepID=A0ABZ1AUJ0_9ACTN|nr:hypothetical protein [Blastococcus sp. BMG 8361]WRL62246.1 hypothetical protein U6N30_19680 [Blastococcus sp. BMG 8361]